MSKGNGLSLGHSARVHQAQGMVSVQASCSMEAALALMQSAADTAEDTLDFVAEEVLGGRVRFD